MRAARHTRSLFAAALLLGAGSSRADGPAATSVLSARLVGLRSDDGRIGCELFTSPKGFPKDATQAAQVKWCPIVSRESRCDFNPLPAGTYAVVCFHDENGNGKLDTGFLGIPTEGVVVSNHATGTMGPPSFKDAKFSFSATTELRLKMRYL